MNPHNERKICRLCLQICDQYEIIETATREMLNAIFPKLNVDISNKPVICDKCALNLKKSLGFKSMAYTQVCFGPLIKQENATFDPHQTFMIEKDNGNTRECQTVCGMCMSLVKPGFFIPLDNVDEEGIFQRIMLEECLPDLNLSTTKNPVICTPCNKSLKSHYNFITECSSIEQNIKLYCETEGINGGKINLNSVRKFMYGGMYCAGDSYIVEEEHCKDQENCDDEIEIETKYDIEITEENLVSDADEKFDINADQHDSSEIGMIFQQLEVAVNSSTSGTISALKTHESYSERPKRKRSLEESCSGITKHEADNYLIKVEDNIEKYKIAHKNISEKIIYKCQTCVYTTNCENNLTQHMLTHTEKIIMYQCESCSFQSKRKGLLEKHELIHKSPSDFTMYPCKFCSYTTKYKGNVKVHMQRCKKSLLRAKSNKATVHRCKYCSYNTKYEDNLKKHLQTCKTNRVTVHPCKYCSYSTKYKANLERHLQSCRTSLLRTKSKKVAGYRCKYCSFSTKYEGNLKKHLQTCKTNRVTVHPCKYCSYSTKYKANLERHLQTCKTFLLRTKSKKVAGYRCKYCSFSTKYNMSFKRHFLTCKTYLLQTKSNEVTVYPCNYCQFTAKFKWNLQKHLKICKFKKHSSEEIASKVNQMNSSVIKLHQCTLCSYQARFKKQLNVHMLKHKKLVKVESQ